MSLAATGALLGLVAGIGLVIVAIRSPRARRIRYADRIEPYLRDTPAPSRLLDESAAHAARRSARVAPTPLAAVEALARPFLEDAARRLDRFLGGRAGLVRRLTQAGGRTSVEEFRTQQVILAVAGGLVGAVLLVPRAVIGVGPPPVVGVALIVAGVAGGVVGREWWLTRAIRAREDRMLMEFPTIAELLALAVTAGESPVGALERVARLTHGELGYELRLALADARAGATLVQALEGIATRTTLGSLARFVDGMAVAIERGTPLADVLRAQAVDVREAGRRQLLESGGRKEIAMMVPVVFLVLPTTVIFAFYPALVSFTFFAQ
ncbi:type II secretion system F family protein [Frankia sp. AgB1.9]|uniref:type II secretion system F family protein n=1 Tax=unclassified Frankia TaxID=2632575 RepID=UPI001934AAD7|nr:MULTISPECIES: type II secretion system F family protein [unclassified Frankia]MBL7491994.1 type II secretion system F family protein [Frankia sp. AgW1.1]MBL7548367.1 type II secretion system F family protein [Frankia sp. AgB1.9]MBL7619075.1 type II secretion system F family protein [Frankia sp. AgB1.8]